MIHKAKRHQTQKLLLHVENMAPNTRKFKQQAKHQRAGVKGRRGGGWEREKRRKRRRRGKKEEGWRTWAREMSAPQGGRPVLSTANRRGKHLQDKQSAHYLREHWHCRQQDTSLQKHHCSYTPKASFQNARAASGCETLPPPHSHHATVWLGNVLNLTLTPWSLFLSHLSIFSAFEIWLILFWKEALCGYLPRKQKVHHHWGWVSLHFVLVSIPLFLKHKCVYKKRQSSQM